MIIKNIAPYSKEIKALKLHLLPGQEADVSEFSAKERQDCFELQEAFRKGEFICIGVGRHDREAPSVEARAQRAFSQGGHGYQPSVKIEPVYKPTLEGSEPMHRRYGASDEDKAESVVKYGRTERSEASGVNAIDARAQRAFSQGSFGAQPTIKVKAEYRPSLEGSETTHRRHTSDTKEQVRYNRSERGGVQHIDRPQGIMEKDAHGVMSIRPIERIPSLPKSIEESKPTELPTISRERAREIIMASQCIGVGQSGRRCKRRPVTGYEYCIMHMPKNLLEQYHNQKKQSFFKE